jgi:hypothetical protein
VIGVVGVFYFQIIKNYLDKANKKAAPLSGFVVLA